MASNISYVLAFLYALSSTSALADIIISEAWVRATIAGGSVTAGYAVITNSGAEPDRLLGVSSTAAGRIELHQSSAAGGMVSMSAVDTVRIPPAGRIELKPGDFHMMIMQVRAPLKSGDTIPLRFQFERGGIVDTVARVAPLSAISAPLP